METKKEDNAYGVASMICGIISIPAMFAPYFGLPLSIMAICFHGVQKKKGLNGYATAGLVLGIIGVVLNVIMGLILLAGLFVLGMLG